MDRSILEKLPFWDSLTGEERDLVARSSTIREFQRGESIHGADSACLGLALVLEGMVRVSMLSDQGREITLFRLAQGETCVLSASCIITQITFETEMAAEEPCSLLVVAPTAVDTLSEQNIYARCFLFEKTTERFSDVMWTMQQLLFNSLDQRLAAFLLDESVRTGSRDLRLTHEQIAVQISSAREAVARTLKRFAAEGLIRTGRGRLGLTDPDGLRAKL